MPGSTSVMPGDRHRQERRPAPRGQQHLGASRLAGDLTTSALAPAASTTAGPDASAEALPQESQPSGATTGAPASSCRERRLDDASASFTSSTSVVQAGDGDRSRCLGISRWSCHGRTGDQAGVLRHASCEATWKDVTSYSGFAASAASPGGEDPTPLESASRKLASASDAAAAGTRKRNRREGDQSHSSAARRTRRPGRHSRAGNRCLCVQPSITLVGSGDAWSGCATDGDRRPRKTRRSGWTPLG